MLVTVNGLLCEQVEASTTLDEVGGTDCRRVHRPEDATRRRSDRTTAQRLPRRTDD